MKDTSTPDCEDRLLASMMFAGYLGVIYGAAIQLAYPSEDYGGEVVSAAKHGILAFLYPLTAPVYILSKLMKYFSPTGQRNATVHPVEYRPLVTKSAEKQG